MNQKADVVGLVVGGGMAAGPAMVNVPFYESNTWLSAVAILGITVLALTALNAILNLRRNLKWDGHDRRGEKR